MAAPDVVQPLLCNVLKSKIIKCYGQLTRILASKQNSAQLKFHVKFSWFYPRLLHGDQGEASVICDISATAPTLGTFKPILPRFSVIFPILSETDYVSHSDKASLYV